MKAQKNTIQELRRIFNPSRKNDLLILLFLTGFAFLINRHMEIKGLYMDDLSQWFYYNTQSFWQAVFPLGGTRFRFVYNLVSWMQMKIFGIHIGWYIPFNIILNTAIAFMLYRMSRKFSRSIYVGLLCAVIFLTSRMSYYQIGQILGLMESMAMIMALVILFLLYGYLNERDGRENRRLLWAVILYFTVCFVHERYMALIPLFFLVLIFRRVRDWWTWALPTGAFAAVQILRLLTIGTLLPAGTGGTDVADTITVNSAIQFGLSQAAYLFGINAGPEYLNGQNFHTAPRHILALVASADVALLLIIIIFSRHMMKQDDRKVGYLQTACLFLAFIGACITCSSVTIRVEMRWVYVSYAAALLFLSWICGVLTAESDSRAGRIKGIPCLALVTLYVALMFPAEHYYRGLFPALYYWEDQERYNTLAEETYGRYGTELFGKTIYIVGNEFEMSQFTESNFFKVFDPLRRDNCVTVAHIADVREIGLVADGMLVIQEDPENNRFQDVTHVVKTLKCRPIYGFYGDGWLDEKAKVQVMAGSTGKIELSFNYPRDLTGDQKLSIYVDDRLRETVCFTEQAEKATVQVTPYETVSLRFESNFYVPAAQEQRGETRLAVLLSISAD